MSNINVTIRMINALSNSKKYQKKLNYIKYYGINISRLNYNSLHLGEYYFFAFSISIAIFEGSPINVILPFLSIINFEGILSIL